jgi:hypothetical protein
VISMECVYQTLCCRWACFSLCHGLSIHSWFFLLLLLLSSFFLLFFFFLSPSLLLSLSLSLSEFYRIWA